LIGNNFGQNDTETVLSEANPEKLNGLKQNAGDLRDSSLAASEHFRLGPRETFLSIFLMLSHFPK